MTLVEDLRAEVGAGVTVPTTTLERYVALAELLVDEYLSAAGEEVTVPGPLTDQAKLACAAEMFNISRAPNGVLNQQYEASDGALTSVPVRISGDPLRPVRPLLAPWISGLTT